MSSNAKLLNENIPFRLEENLTPERKDNIVQLDGNDKK